MLKIKNTIKNYNIGNSKIELKFADLFTDIKNGLVLNTKPTFCSVSNVGIVKDIELFTDKITFVPTKQIRTSNKIYNCIIKISANVPKLNASGQFDSTLGTVDKYYYIKIKLCPKIDGSDSELYVEAYEKLSPDQYQADKQHEKDNLDALVSKKALINNLKEFGNQVKNKIANTHKYEIKYDLAGGFWPNNNEGRHTFCNAEAYAPLPPEKNGYIFKGWQLYKIEDETGTPLIPKNEIDVDNMIQVGTDYDVEAEAFWNPEVITINVRNSEGEIKGTVSIKYSEDLVLKDIIKGIAAPTKDCYILNGWEIKSSTYEKKIVFKDDIEFYDLFSINDYSTTIDLYPVYRPITAEIVFNFGTDTSIYLPDFKSKGNKYTYGQAFVLPVPYKLNYRFKGWIIKQKGKEGEPLLKNADTDDKLHFIIDAFELAGYDKDTKLELTPEFEKQYISINYHLSDSSLIPYMSGVDPTKYTTKFTRNELTPPNKVLLIAPSSTGFNFTGWKLGKDIENIFQITVENEKYYLSVLDLKEFNKKELGATIDLYAIWEAENVDVTVEIWGEYTNSTGKYIAKDSDGVVEYDTCTYGLVSTHIVKDFKALQKKVTLSEIKGKLPGHLININGFKLKKFTKNDDSELIQIKPDGSTVVKLYYYREEYEVRVNDVIEGGYLNENKPIKLKRIFKDGKMSKWKSILSTSDTELGYKDYFIAKYGQIITQEAEFIKDFNSDNTYGELTLECYSLPASTIQSKEVFRGNIDFTFEYTRKSYPIILNLNGYGYFGDISNPTYSVTNTVLANTKAKDVLHEGNFKYKVYWVYKDDIFNIPNEDEIITGPKVYNLEKKANISDENTWREFNVTTFLHEDNGIDLVYNETSNTDELDINATDIINSQLFYDSKNNTRRTNFNKLKNLNLPNTKLKNYWLTNLNIHVNNSPNQPTTLKNLDIEYFEKRIPSTLTTTDDVQVTFVPFVERLEPDIAASQITLSNITSENFTVNGIVAKDGTSHVLVSLNNLNYENIINISHECKKIGSSISIKREATITNDTIIYFIAIKKIRKNSSDFFVTGKMYGTKVIVDGTTANLNNWQEVALPNIALKQNPYIISIKKNESAVNCIEFTDIEFSEEIEDLVFTIKNVSTNYANMNCYTVFAKLFTSESNNITTNAIDNDKNNNICAYTINLDNNLKKKIYKVQLYILPTYYRDEIQNNILNSYASNFTFDLDFEIGLNCTIEKNSETKYVLFTQNKHKLKYKLIQNSKYIACINNNTNTNWGDCTFAYNKGIKELASNSFISWFKNREITNINSRNQLFYTNSIILSSIKKYNKIAAYFDIKNLNTNSFQLLDNKYIKFVGIYTKGIANSSNTNNCEHRLDSDNNLERFYNLNWWYSYSLVYNYPEQKSKNYQFDDIYISNFKSFLELSNSDSIVAEQNNYTSVIDSLYFDLVNTYSKNDYTVFKVGSVGSVGEDITSNFQINRVNTIINNIDNKTNILLNNKNYIKLNLTELNSILGKNYSTEPNNYYNSYKTLAELIPATITSNNITLKPNQDYNIINQGDKLQVNVEIEALPVYSYEGVDILS